MNFLRPVNPEVFKAIQKLDTETLSKFPESDLQAILPCLVRISLISPVDIVPKCTELRQLILCILSGIEHVNSIVALLSIDFHGLETDVRKEQQLRQKGSHLTATGAEFGTIILQQKPILHGISLEFERSDSTRRIRLVINELLQIQSQKQNMDSGDFFFKDSDLFDNGMYLEEISDVICISLAELPSLFPICDVVELLLHVRNGSTLITWIVANFPDTFLEVCSNLIENSDKDNDDSFNNQVRFKTLKELCTMNPSDNLTVRMKAIEMNRMASLAIYLTLNQVHNNDLVSFMSGLLLGADQTNRNWFAQFIRTRQKKKVVASTPVTTAGGSNAPASSITASTVAATDIDSPSMIVLQLLRTKLIDKLVAVKKSAINDTLSSDMNLVKASALLKVYCALRGIGGIKFQDDEVNHLVNIITLRAAVTSAGVRFISLGLCTLIACPSIISQSVENEKRCIEWIQSLIREETYFTVSDSRSTDSFGEMLLLMAIHFHSNQMNAICDLVCGTLGMRVAIRSNSLSRIRAIFIQDIFTEQVVAAHAVKVPVTSQLNGSMTGFLPIHCIYQLIKSRVFIKYRINIKTWIYRQILATTSPLHPIWSLLIDAYVNSIVNQQQQQTPLTDIQAMIISEQEILDVFLDKSGVYYDSESLLTAQILLIYFVLLYEDNCLANNTLKAIYTGEFIGRLPIKYLLQKIHTHSHMISFSVLFGSLLRLLAMNHPHLYLVDDLMDIEQGGNGVDTVVRNGNMSKKMLNPEIVANALKCVCTQPKVAYKVLSILNNQYRPMELWKEFLHVIVSEIGTMLDLINVPRHIQELYANIWFKLNSVLPCNLWKLTIDSLLKLSNNKYWNKSNWYLENKSITDPLTVLSCDIRAFRCAPVLNIILRVLKSNLACSRSELDRHIKTTSLMILDKTSIGIPGIAMNQLVGDQERDELRLALIAAQESTAVQILLDRCMINESEKKFPGFDWALRECRGIVCSFLHQMFLSDIALVKLVHFQGYPRELLEMTVTSIPSMHICLDFIPELVSLPDWEKQVFAIHLVAHLSVQYSLPKSLSMAKLALNTLHTLIEVVPSSLFIISIQPILDDLPLICIAFPILNTDVIDLLLRMGRICQSLTTANAVLKSAAFKEKLLLSVVQKQITLVYETIIQKTVLRN